MHIIKKTGKKLKLARFALSAILALSALAAFTAFAAFGAEFNEYLVEIEEQVCEKVYELERSDLSVEQRLALEDLLKKAEWKPPVNLIDKLFEKGSGEMTQDQRIERKSRIEARVSRMTEKQKLARIDKLQSLLDSLENVTTD